jgi:acyl dehydratase
MKAKEKVTMHDSVLTDELIEEMRSRQGTKLRCDHTVGNEEATRMAILKFADGVGDHNRLWRDADYAGKSVYGTIVAPPSWILSVLAGMQFGWRGLGGFHNASTLEFYRPILLNDKIMVEVFFKHFEGPSPSKFAEQVVTNFKEANYYNQRDELVAANKWSVMRFARSSARKKSKGGKYSNIALPHPWTEEELKRIEEEVLTEEPRGSQVRYWEDVEIGEALTPIVKGPIGLTDMIAFLIGGGAPIPRMAAHGVALRQYREHPAWAFRDPHTFAKEPIFAVHYHKEAANAMGLPLPYDVGTQRHAWQIQMLTNWASDEGWIKSTNMELRRHVFLSDVVRFTGKVTRKYVDGDGEYCVDVETSAVNQRGEDVMPGQATIALASREKGLCPVTKRLPS